MNKRCLFFFAIIPLNCISLTSLYGDQPMQPIKTFASDNYSGAHPAIIQALMDANQGHVKAYGDDPYTARAITKFKEHFGQNIDVYFVCNGTAANILGLRTITESFQAVICAQTAHINTSECGGLENFVGCKLFLVPTTDGKITVDGIKAHLQCVGDLHQAQPKVISITQVTEYGTIYTLQEIKAIAAFAHANNLYLHMDGARLANAAASLGCTLKQLTVDVGVDVLSFGGTKNGGMFGDAVIFFSSELSTQFKYIRKGGMQLTSKMRFIAVQLEALLTNDVWLTNAKHANRMAQVLVKELEQFKEITITQKTEANEIFAVFPSQIIPVLQAQYPFYVWDEPTNEIRLVTSFDTTEDDVKQFVAAVKKLLE